MMDKILGQTETVFFYFNVLTFLKKLTIMTRVFLIFKYVLHKKDFTAQGLVTVRRPMSVFFLTNIGHLDV